MTHLRDAFRYWLSRPNSGYRETGESITPFAIRMARVDVANKKPRYPKDDLGFKGGVPFKAYGETAMVWCENPAGYLRYVGTCHDILSRHHKGWYIDDESGETAHGVVYQLPSRKGSTRYLYGYADPFNDGPACLSLSIERDKDNAARYADSVAERYAEKEREYNTAWRAGREYDELGDAATATRRACLALISEAKKACARMSELPAIKSAIRVAVASHVGQIRDARDKRETLFQAFGRCEGFAE